MKLSDYVAQFLAERGVRQVFAITGGASVHLIDSIAKCPGIDFVCPQHEQAGAMAADAYARVTGSFGVAISTSGPGATNMITGICCAYYDSVPVLYITGQVSTFRSKGTTGVRQIGFQETDIVPMCRHITNYAVHLRDARQVRYELEKACYMACCGRPGPVLIDIPDDLQRADVQVDGLSGFVPPVEASHDACPDEVAALVAACVELLCKSTRPVLVLGWGVHLSGAEEVARALVRRSGMPVAPTWAAADIVGSDDRHCVGTFGTHGTRHGNFAVQNADLILSVGSRLDTKATGSPPSTFARGARKIMIDIDGTEIRKFSAMGMSVDLSVACDAKMFLALLVERLEDVRLPSIDDWLDRIAEWKRRYPSCPHEYYSESGLNPYVFVKELAKATSENATIVVDTGCTVAWMMQAFEFKPGQRLYHDWNNTAMGWALPASIGASFALGKKEIICVTGDGSLQMNIQELATVVRHKLPVKIFLLNNRGYSMVRQTQEQWFDSRYTATSVEGGLGFPDFGKVAAAYGLPVQDITQVSEIAARVETALRLDGPVFCSVEIDPANRVVPQVKYGRPNEDAEPLLDRDEFLRNMLVPPMEKN